MNNDTNTEQEIRRFFKGAKQGCDILKPVVVELDRHLARRFNFFYAIDFFDSIPSKKEDRISYVFAYLFDLNEAHGQGDLFLRKFLEDVAPNWLPNNCWSSVSVRTEVLTTRIKRNREIDIVIAFGGDQRAVAIENKPWAADQDQQLSDYARHLELMYGKKCFKLIYLTPNGEPPSDDSNSIDPREREDRENKGQLGYASIQDWAGNNGWLKRAENEVKAERVRWFVSDFRKALIESLREPPSAGIGDQA